MLLTHYSELTRTKDTTMRARVPLAIAAASVLTLGVAGPVFAAGANYTWDAGGSPNKEWSTAANWGGTPFDNDDLLTFSAGDLAHNDLVGKDVRGMTMSMAGFTVNGSKITLGAGGITTNASATTNMDIDLTASQTWTSASGTTLTNQGTVNVLSGTLTFDGEGTVDFSTRLDGNGGAGSVTKSGGGTLILSGGGGAIGGGLQINSGETRVTGMLAGTDFVVNGGTMTGGHFTNALLGVVRILTLNSGTISPGVGAGAVSTIHTWEPFTANAGGVLEFDVNGTTSDGIENYKSAVLNGATLHLNVVSAPPVGTILPIVTSQIGTVSGTITTRTGDIISAGDFTDNGHRWRLAMSPGAASVEYLGAVPTPAADPDLASTGATSGWLIPIGGGLLLIGVVQLVLRRKFVIRSNN